MKPTILIIAIIIMSIIPLSVTAQQPQGQPTPTATLVYDVNKSGPLTEAELHMLESTPANYDNYLQWQDLNNGYIAELNYHVDNNEFGEYRVTAKAYMKDVVPGMYAACKGIAGNGYVSARTDALRQHNVQFWLTCNKQLMNSALLAISTHQSEGNKTTHAGIYLNYMTVDGLVLVERVYELSQ